MDCHLLVLGGNGNLVNTIIPFLPPKTVIAGRYRPEEAGNYQFIEYDLRHGINAIVEQIQNVDAILNCTVVVDYFNSAANGFNYESLRTVASLSKHFNCRCIQISTLKCEARDFMKESPYTHPLSPYGWSKLCAEFLLKDLWKNSSIIRLALVEGSHNRSYYDKSLFVANVTVSTVTPRVVWNTIEREINEKGWRIVHAKTSEKRLIDLTKEITGKKIVVPIPINFLNWFLKRMPTKLLDYLV